MIDCNLYTFLKGEPGCVLCPAGYECPTTSTKTPCTVGTHYSLGGATACTECPSGMACPLPNVGPIVCEPGQTTNGLQGASSCTDCVPGTSCADPT